VSQRFRLWGLLADFGGPAELVAAARAAHAAGYRRTDAYTPFPVEGLAEELGHRRTILPLIVLAGAIAGGVGGYAMQYYTSVIDYPLNVGGRPLHSWPMFVPVTFELTILLAALAAVLGMLALNGLPRPHHPLFGVERFERATRDGFFLAIEADDPKFDPIATREFLMALGANDVSEVPL